MPFKAQSTDTGSTTSGNDVIFTIPASAIAGDSMYVVLLHDDASTPDPPVLTPPSTETWTLIQGDIITADPQAPSPPICWIYRKDVSADDEANAGTKTYTFEFAPFDEAMGWLGLYDHSEDGQFADNPQSGNDTTATAPAVTTTQPNEIAIFVGYRDSATAFSGIPNSQAVERLNATVGTGTGGGAMAIVEQTFPTPQDTGTKDFTLPSNDQRSGFTFSFYPVSVSTRRIFIIT